MQKNHTSAGASFFDLDAGFSTLLDFDGFSSATFTSCLGPTTIVSGSSAFPFAPVKLAAYEVISLM